MKFLAGFVVAIALLVLGGLAFIYSGVFNVAASPPHTTVGRWVLNTTKQQSIEARADVVTAPEKFTDEQVHEGFRAYNEMCVICHGAPGKEASEIGKGLEPRPPDLAEAAKRWEPRELFWIVKNGIKMTGMPAFGNTHDDQEIWSVVAFVQQLPNVTAEQFTRLEGKPNGGQHSH